MNFYGDGATTIRLTSAVEAVSFTGVANAENQLWVISAATPGESVGEPTMLEHSEVLFDYLVDATPIVATCPDATGRIAPATELPFAAGHQRQQRHHRQFVDDAAVVGHLLRGSSIARSVT